MLQKDFQHVNVTHCLHFVLSHMQGGAMEHVENQVEHFSKLRHQLTMNYNFPLSMSWSFFGEVAASAAHKAGITARKAMAFPAIACCS